MADIPIAPLKRLIKDCGAERVSESAAEYLKTVLTKNAVNLSEKAVVMANVSGRKTVTDEDFRNALKYFQG